jgi:hypothetical protein
VGREVRGELGVGRHRGGIGVLGQELELLAHAAAHDGVVAVEAERNRLAVEHLVPDEVVDETGQLRVRRRALPRPREALRERVDPSAADRDLPGRRRVPGERAMEREERGAEQQEVDERLAREPHHQGVYQIGEL